MSLRARTSRWSRAIFKKISDKIRFGKWASARFQRLEKFDRLLDGSFYDHLSYSFYDETEGQNRYIPLEDRRPSVQYNLCAFVARKIARKLFSGRHAPRYAHENEDLTMAATALAREGFLQKKLIRAAVWSSVGACCITFKLEPDGDQQMRIVFEVWRAKWCEPTFDKLGELSRLRIAYLTYGYNFKAFYNVEVDDDDEPIADDEQYWHVSDIDTERWTLYRPKPKDSWPPNDKHPLKLMGENNQPAPHNFGFVPAQWFVNLVGGDDIDGECLFDLAKNTAIDIDYTISSLGRGVRYNASPEVVITGKRKNATIDDATNKMIVRGPTHVIELEAAKRDPSGMTVGGGTASLLEMTGQGISVGLELVEQLRKYALEAIAASRKDPDKIGGPQSGRAMEMLDDDPLDLYDEMREALGENGALPLVRKAMRAAKKVRHKLVADVDLSELDALAYYWPKPYQPGAQELQQIGQGLQALTTPTAEEHETEPGPAVPGADGAPGKPGAPQQTGTVKQRPIMTIDQASRLLSTYVDIPPDVASMPNQQEPVPEGDDSGEPPSPPPTEPAAADRQGDDDFTQPHPRRPKGRAPRKKVTK